MIEPDEHLKAIFDEAVKVARANDHEYITLEHIALVLLTQPDVAELLKGTKKVKYPNLVKDLTEHVEQKLNEIKTKQVEIPKRTQAIDRMVNRAFTQAIFSGHDIVTGVHLLNSMFNEKESHAVYYLSKNGVDKKLIVDQLEEVVEDTKENVQVSSKQASKILKQYTVNLNEQAKASKTFTCIGRQDVIDEITLVLGRKIKNNVIMIGDPVGKMQ